MQFRRVMFLLRIKMAARDENTWYSIKNTFCCLAIFGIMVCREREQREESRNSFVGLEYGNRKCQIFEILKNVPTFS